MSILNQNAEQKFEELYHAYVDEIYQYIYLRTGLQKTVAEDITQEIFISVYKSFSSYKGICSERTWIYKITKNKLNDFYRKQYRNQFTEVEMSDSLTEILKDPNQDIQAGFIKSYESKRVKECLQSLPQPYGIVLTLKYIDEKSVKEIAAMLFRTPKAIESILQRAKSAFIKTYKSKE